MSPLMPSPAATMASLLTSMLLNMTTLTVIRLPARYSPAMLRHFHPLPG